MQRNRAEKSLLFATQAVNASPVVCYRSKTTEGWPIVFISDNVRQWGYTPEQILAGKPSVFEVIHPDDLPHLITEAEGFFAAGTTNYEQEYRLLTSQNQVVWVRVARQ